jgi:hypothetical protein
MPHCKERFVCEPKESCRWNEVVFVVRNQTVMGEQVLDAVKPNIVVSASFGITSDKDFTTIIAHMQLLSLPEVLLRLFG